GEPDLPGGLVGDAEFERLGLAALDHVERLGDDLTFDASTRYRAKKVALLVDDQIGADRPRRRAPGLDHGRERYAAALAAPVLGSLQDVFVARECVHASNLLGVGPSLALRAVRDTTKIVAHAASFSQAFLSQALGSPPWAPLTDSARTSCA